MINVTYGKIFYTVFHEDSILGIFLLNAVLFDMLTIIHKTYHASHTDRRKRKRKKSIIS